MLVWCCQRKFICEGLGERPAESFKTRFLVYRFMKLRLLNIQIYDTALAQSS